MSILLHGIGKAFLDDMARFAATIPPEVGEAAAANIKNAVAAMFPGPPARRTAALAMIVAHAIGDLLSEIEPASPILSPGTDGRVKAVEAAFSESLRGAIQNRAVVNHRNRIITNGGLN